MSSVHAPAQVSKIKGFVYKLSYNVSLITLVGKAKTTLPNDVKFGIIASPKLFNGIGSFGAE